MKQKLISILILAVGVNFHLFAQGCPCVKTKIIGNDAQAGFSHNNRIVAMEDVVINCGEQIRLHTKICVGKAIWYKKGNKNPLNNLLQKPPISTTYIVKSVLNGCPDMYDTLKVRVKSGRLPGSSSDYIVSPNPASDELQIVDKTSTFYKIQLCDISGKIRIEQKKLNNVSSHKIDISSLPEDVYILKIYSKNRTYSTKIVKQ